MELSFDKIYKIVCAGFEQVIDHRAHNISYSLSDMLKSGFAIFSLKSPSLLSFKNRTEIEDCNLGSIYDITDIPSDSCFRKTLDQVNPNALKHIFNHLYFYLKKQGWLKAYEVREGFKIISLDGVHHYSSEKVKCEHCLVKEHRDGSKIYQHSMLAAVMVHPDKREVYPIDCEAIIKEDGKINNDCELAASKRLITSMLAHYKKERFLIVADALYSVNPFVKQIKGAGWSFVLGVKPKRHKALFALYEGRKNRGQLNEYEIIKDGVHHKFSMLNNVSLTNQKDTVKVNFIHYIQTDQKGEQKTFTWITDIKLSKKNCEQIMQIGRSRWKIENETFNTLKNQGYHFEHNYGHGTNHLSTILAILMLLAFTVDQMQQHGCKLFIAIWDKLKQKSKLWESLRSIFMIVPCESMENLLIKMTQIWNVPLEDP